MNQEGSERGVFLHDEPTLDKLKSCSFFWKNVVVFESYLSNVSGQPSLIESTLILFKEGVLKICHSPQNLRNALTDKIYSGLDKELWEYMYRNADKITVKPDLPKNAEQIIEESTKRDCQDKNLRSLIDTVVYNSIKEKWMDALRENERIPYSSMPSDMRKAMISEMKRITHLEYSHYLQRHSETRLNFEYRNRYLLEQMSVSSSLFTPMAWLPYYSYKFGDYSLRDARRYLRGLNAVMPFAKRESIDSFSLEEIIRIRRNKRWNSAMIKLSELCNDIKYGSDIGQFSKEIQDEVVSEYQNTLELEAVTWKDLGKELLKGSAFAGISFIPIIGGVVSTIAGFVDPLISYFQKEGAQKTLPFFLNDLRKLKP